MTERIGTQAASRVVGGSNDAAGDFRLGRRRGPLFTGPFERPGMKTPLDRGVAGQGRVRQGLSSLRSFSDAAGFAPPQTTPISEDAWGGRNPAVQLFTMGVCFHCLVLHRAGYVFTIFRGISF